MFVVVLNVGGVICGVFGPFASEADAQAYAGPRNDMQRGAMKGTVLRMLEVLADPRDPSAPATVPHLRAIP